MAKDAKIAKPIKGKIAYMATRAEWDATYATPTTRTEPAGKVQYERARGPSVATVTPPNYTCTRSIR